MESTRQYDIRPQARTTPDNVLEGVFRVYLSADALAIEKLKQGDWVALRNRATGNGGLGIAWRVQESNMKKDCVKMHDALRTLYGFELKDKLSLVKYSGDLTPATRIVVRDVTDVGKAGNAAIVSEGLDTLHMAATVALYNADAIAEGFEFTAMCRNGAKASRKRQLRVESVSSNNSAMSDKTLVIPHYFTQTSQIEFADGQQAQTSTAPIEHQSAPLQIDDSGLFGLDRQLKQLNLTMNEMRSQLETLRLPRVACPGPILIYGPPGTGKSTLVRKISEATWNRAFHIKCAQLTVSAEKAKTNLINTFKEAKASSPSCVVLDELEQIASSQAESHIGVASVLADNLRSLRGTQVLVVAATQKSTDIHNRVLRCFDEVVELPIPTENVRFRILEDLMEGVATSDCLQKVAERTPAFVPDDLRRLCSVAVKQAKARMLMNSPVVTNEILRKNGHKVQGEDISDDKKDDRQYSLEVLPGDFDTALNQVHASVMNEAYIEVPKVHWTDIGGSEVVKTKLADVLDFPIKHPDLMSRFKVEPSTGILLYGPPGCSKTLTAKAVATESGRNFIAVKGPELISKYVGESEYKIREVFRRARDAAPSVIFFDEIDSIAPRRDGGGSGHEGLNTVAALLNEMDGIEGSKGVLVLAATNRPEHIDPALLRPQRLGTLLYLGPPGPEARKQILQMKTVGRQPDALLDIDALVTRTDGYSGADVVELCNLAALQAVKDEAVRRDDSVRLGIDHFEEAFREMKPTLSGDVVKYLEEWQVAGVAKI